MLRDLDLSSNALEGPLGPTTVPALSHLANLQLSDNTFASIRRGALAGNVNDYLSSSYGRYPLGFKAPRICNNSNIDGQLHSALCSCKNRHHVER